MAQSHPEGKMEQQKKSGKFRGLGNVVLKEDVTAHLHITSFSVTGRDEFADLCEGEFLL